MPFHEARHEDQPTELNDLSDPRISQLVEEFGGHYLMNPKEPDEPLKNTVKDMLEDPVCGLYDMIINLPSEVQVETIRPFLGAKKLDDANS
jgi:hypothetical protein